MTMHDGEKRSSRPKVDIWNPTLIDSGKIQEVLLMIFTIFF